MYPTPPRSRSARKIAASGPQGVARWGYFLLLVGVPLAFAGYASYLTFFFYTRYGPVAAIYRPRPYWLAAAVTGLIALILCIRARWRARTFLMLDASGITLHLAPQKPFALAWEDITGVQVRLARTLLPSRWRGHIALHGRDGSQTRIDNRFPDLPGLAQEIQRRWYAVHLPGLRGAWAAGDTLTFGEITISRHGLRWRQRNHPWHTIRTVTVQRGRLVIELTTQRNLRIPLHRVHNPHVLLWWLHKEAKR